MREQSLHEAFVHPLTALAIRLHAAGTTGYEGEVDLVGDEAAFGRLRIKGPAVDLDVQGDTLAMPATLPESLIPALAGRRLGEVATLPLCGDRAVDDAVASMRVLTVETGIRAGRPVLLLGMEPAGRVRAMPHAPG